MKKEKENVLPNQPKPEPLYQQNTKYENGCSGSAIHKSSKSILLFLCPLPIRCEQRD